MLLKSAYFIELDAIVFTLLFQLGYMQVNDGLTPFLMKLAWCGRAEWHKSALSD